MTDAPETIWAAPPWSDEAWEGGAGEWDVSKNWACDFKVEYTRTDIADAREVTQIEGVKDLADTVIKHEARIEELEAALAPFAAMIRPNTFDPKGIARFGVSGRAGNDDYRAAYAALNIAKDKGE
jgi:hypothetical protein